MQNVQGKVILITGASSGIGEATAKTLAAHGAKVVLSARRGDRLEKLAAGIGENAVYLASDVTNPDDMEALVTLAKSKFGRLDVLFANAGIMPGSNMSEHKVNDWMAMVDVNIKGVLNAMAAVLPEFIAQKRGHIIVTSSIAGTRSVPGNAVYAGTKHFVRAMLDSFRMESVMEGTNIRTTTIYPGAIRTELLHTIAPSETKSMVEAFYRDAGLDPDVIANAVLYAVAQPDNVDVSDLAVRPSKES
nr:SDR family oxidoreductase [uncultured Agathobaculum sp.]